MDAFSILPGMISPLNKPDFEKTIGALCDPSLLYSSRVHPLPSFHTSSSKVYVKREDESGFGISGAKKRKYASLLLFLKKKGISKVILIGGSRSNNVAGFIQLLNENKIKYKLFLKAEHKKELTGNRLLLELLVDEKDIRWVAKSEWPEVENLAAQQAEKDASFVVPEGGSCLAAFAGACTLGLDILAENQDYDHLWIDSGTALMSGAVIEVLQLFARETRVHVVQMAGSDAYYHRQLQRFHPWMEELAGRPLAFPQNFDLHFPSVGKSFGSVGGTILGFIKQLARTEGILTDPIYSGKLFYTVQQKLLAEEMPGRHLVVHSGGGVGLMGFGGMF